jgi:hypothetical protein
MAGIEPSTPAGGAPPPVTRLYAHRDEAEAAVRALRRAGLPYGRVTVAGPALAGVLAGGPGPSGDLRLRRVSSTPRMVAAGALLGVLLVVALVLTAGMPGEPPAWAPERLLLVVYGLAAGAIAGALVPALEGRPGRLSAVVNIARHGHWAVVAEVADGAEARAARRALDAPDGDAGR